MELEYLDELAEEEETLADDLGVEETREEDSDELGRGEEAKLVSGDSVVNFILLEVEQYIVNPARTQSLNISKKVGCNNLYYVVERL